MGQTRRANPVSARETILSAIRAAAVPPSPAAPHVTGDIRALNLLERFLQVLASVGGRGVSGDPTRSVNDLIAEIVTDLGVGDRADVVVVPGRCAVAENGSVYVDAADLRERADIVRAEHLILVVPHGALVPTMHDAVRLIPVESACGWFLSGPSKTADIEQSLVIGAQGARTLHVVFDREGREIELVVAPSA
ncbi:MAG: LUD domain-containing protein [Gemmatimonadaceae bacterium]|nr:LUD domain-containing protein [Gemmatimonadaceae bacterium]